MLQKLLTLLLGFLLLACQKEEFMPEIKITQTDYSLLAEGGVLEVPYVTNSNNLTLTFDTGTASNQTPHWMSVTNYATKEQTRTLRITYLRNELFEQRNCRIRIQTEHEEIQATISLIQAAKVDSEPSIQSFKLLSVRNSTLLKGDVNGTIATHEDKITCYMSQTTTLHTLRPTITFEGKSLYLQGEEHTPIEEINFATGPHTLVVENHSGVKRAYKLEVITVPNLPKLYINTAGQAPINSKDFYVASTIKLEGMEQVPSLAWTAGNVKGRGNSTWDMAKKPYRIKFDSKHSLAGLPAHKDWVLLANYCDKTSIRNELAFELARATSLAYTPRSLFVELYLNEQYNGLYQLTEQLKIDNNRVNITKSGFLLEVDDWEKANPNEDILFSTNRNLFNIKEPDVELHSAPYNWIKEYITDTENSLYGASFKDPEVGYAHYIDVASFVDWYLVNEILKNQDGYFYSSCYMHIAPDGKLTMGPVWDFDISSGNCNYSNSRLTSGWWIRNYPSWYGRLFEDPAFENQVKARFIALTPHINEVVSRMQQRSKLYIPGKADDESKWKTLGKYIWPNYVWYNSYEEEVAYLLDWMEKRMNWLKGQWRG